MSHMTWQVWSQHFVLRHRLFPQSLKNAIVLAIGAYYGGLDQILATLVFDVISLMLSLRGNAAVIIQAVLIIKTIWDMAGLVIAICW